MRIAFPFHRFLITFALVFVAASSLEADDASSAPFPISQVPKTFKHPGLLNNLDELKRVRQKIEVGEEPWETAFEKMKASKWAALDYVPHPVDVVSSDINGSNDNGAVAEYDDGVAAYSDALLWVLTDDERYAKKAVEILNAWSAVLQTHKGVNWYLQTGWAGSIFPESAELLRATYPGWTSEDIAQFSAMLNRAFLPLLHNRVSFGNREFSVISAMIAIGVFNNDKAAFYEGVCHWVSYVPCYLYLSSDGSEPIKPDYWRTSPSEDVLAKLDANLFPNGVGAWFSVKFKSPGEDFYMKSQPIGKVWSNPVVYVNGLCAETCRDFTHTECGFAAMINTAEIAWHQGVDLYSTEDTRITTFMEFNNALRLGGPIPPGLHNGTLNFLGVAPTFEIAYNHYHNRKGTELPVTRDYIVKVIRSLHATSTGTSPPPGIAAKFLHGQVVLNAAWETLTHAELDAPSPTQKSH